MMATWQIFAVVVALMAAWSVVVMVAIRTMIGKSLGDIDRKILELGDIRTDQQRLERAILELKADLPLNYVRKEDFVRHEVVINAKLDRLRDLIEDLRGKRDE